MSEDFEDLFLSFIDVFEARCALQRARFKDFDYNAFQSKSILYKRKLKKLKTKFDSYIKVMCHPPSAEE